jgi:16S rRNA (guanine1516-N2)-methyltransferase
MSTDEAKHQFARMAFAYDGSDDSVRERAIAWASELKLPVITSPSDCAGAFDFYLTLTARRLELREASVSRSRPLYVDFVSGATAHRGRSSRGRRELIARTIGIKPGEGYVVDATAGLARDAFQLAAIGYSILAIERSPILSALVADALHRARAARDTPPGQVVERIALRLGDARDILPELARKEPPEVVYLDPMFSPKSKSALENKEIRICRRIVGDDSDAAELLKIALASARRRVVVKRHVQAPPLHQPPDVSFKGRSVRYDVYLTRHRNVGKS